MSRTTVYCVPRSGHILPVAEYHNAWGAAPRVWTPLCGKYLAKPNEDANAAFCRWLQSFGKGEDAVANLFTDPRLDRLERLVLGWTFDWAVVEAARDAAMGLALREFDARYPVAEGRVNHLPALANFYLGAEERLDQMTATCKSRGGVALPLDWLGWCVEQTSVSDSWTVRSDDGEESHKYDPSRDSGAWFVFREVERRLFDGRPQP